MGTTLQRYVHPLRSTQELLSVLADGSAVPAESVGVKADLSPIRRKIDQLVRETPAGDKRSWWDAELVEPLHRELHGLPVRVAADMRFWHWLCTAEFSELVWRRWAPGGEVPDRPEEVLTTALVGRFLGSATLHGVSRNCLARLWWCAHALFSDKDGYRLVRAALAKQDLFQAIFERKFGLYAPAARACIRRLRNSAEKDFRSATEKLNQYLTTIVLESLNEKDVEKLLSL
jgi:hypothetical protein